MSKVSREKRESLAQFVAFDEDEVRITAAFGMLASRRHFITIGLETDGEFDWESESGYKYPDGGFLLVGGLTQEQTQRLIDMLQKAVDSCP